MKFDRLLEIVVYLMTVLAKISYHCQTIERRFETLIERENGESVTVFLNKSPRNKTSCTEYGAKCNGSKCEWCQCVSPTNHLMTYDEKCVTLEKVYNKIEVKECLLSKLSKLSKRIPILTITRNISTNNQTNIQIYEKTERISGNYNCHASALYSLSTKEIDVLFGSEGSQKVLFIKTVLGVTLKFNFTKEELQNITGQMIYAKIKCIFNKKYLNTCFVFNVEGPYISDTTVNPSLHTSAIPSISPTNKGVRGGISKKLVKPLVIIGSIVLVFLVIVVYIFYKKYKFNKSRTNIGEEVQSTATNRALQNNYIYSDQLSNSNTYASVTNSLNSCNNGNRVNKANTVGSSSNDDDSERYEAINPEFGKDNYETVVPNVKRDGKTPCYEAVSHTTSSNLEDVNINVESGDNKDENDYFELDPDNYNPENHRIHEDHKNGDQIENKNNSNNVSVSDQTTDTNISPNDKSENKTIGHNNDVSLNKCGNGEDNSQIPKTTERKQSLEEINPYYDTSELDNKNIKINDLYEETTLQNH